MQLHTKYFIKTIGFTIVVISPVFTQQDNLNQYIQQAQENNPVIQQAYSRWQSAEADIAVAKGLPNPILSFGYFLESVETAAGPQQYKMGLMQKFPFLGKRELQGKIQAAKAEKTYYAFQKKRLSLNHEVRSTWYNYYYLARITDLTKQNFDLIQNWDSVIRSKYVTARAGHPDLIKTQIELIQLEDELSTLENKKSPLLERFRSLLNDNELSNIRVPDSLDYSQNDVDLSDLFGKILEGNPDLLSANSEIDLQKARVKRSKLNRMPDIGIGIEKITTGEKEGSAFSGKDPLIAKLSLDIPIWFKKNNASITSANHALAGAERQVSSVINDLKTQLENVLFELGESERQIQLYKQILIPKGMESLGATEIAYRADKIEFLSLVDAQRRLLQFQMKYEKALVDYLKAKSKLSVLTGEGIL
ncbi:MAG: TolC family protein [Candidatus Marinimicrobia bacterium]|nr:TolC family protein [Candidatus Neomarinimicrobiota bacterium]MBL7010856.1 TolC family protein [Candidatus Neomarinimicrobiota bacterium]MBL7031192.1 TolC family protein [Candidatus Neomarinimicrobiota bacterium]